MKCYLGTFTAKDKSKVDNRYTYEKKCIYFIAEKKKVVEDFIVAESIDAGGFYKYTLKMCEKPNLKDIGETNGFYPAFPTMMDKTFGYMDISEKEYLADVEVREHDGEYARVKKSFKFIIKARTHGDAGDKIKPYLYRHRLAYYEDCVHYWTTTRAEEIEEVKKGGNYITL